jgi:hypothetical protein
MIWPAIVVCSINILAFVAVFYSLWTERERQIALMEEYKETMAAINRAKWLYEFIDDNGLTFELERWISARSNSSNGARHSAP